MSSLSGSHRNDQGLRAYLEVLAGCAPSTAFLELRHRVSEQTLASSFVPVAHLDEASRRIRELGRGTDVYVGCAPRARRAGTKDAIEQVWVLWAECDGADAARAAHAYRPSPPLIVASGTGPNLHAYWPLREPLSPRAAEEANLRLATALGADAQCFDAGRILRPPGTWNYKRRPPSPVAVVRVSANRRFDADDVVRDAPSVPVERIEHRWRPREARHAGRDPLLRIPPAVYVEALTGVRRARNLKVPCPFHSDERPSLHVYPTPARGWTCFSCGRGGSIYDLAAELWGMQTRGKEFLRLRDLLMERFAVHMALDAERSI